MTSLIVIRFINTAFVIVALFGCIYIWRKYKMPAMITPITWLVNELLFWSVRIFNVPLDVMVVNIWSSALHLHACILIIAALIILKPRE